MYLKNQRNKRTYDKKILKPLKVTTYSKIKNKQRKNRNKDLVQDHPSDQLLPRDKTNEIEKYFLKRVGDTSRKNLNADLTKPSTFEASCKISQAKDKTKKSEFDLINQYLDCSRITAFNNYLSNKDLPKYNLPKQQDENKNTNISKEFSLSHSPDKSEKNGEEKFSIDFLVKQFREPFEKNKMIYLKRNEIIRKELIEVYQLNFLESPQSEEHINKKNVVDCEVQTSMMYQNDQADSQIKFQTNLRENHSDRLPNELKKTIENQLINQGTKSSEVNLFDSFVPKTFLNDSLTEKNLQLKKKVVLKDLKLEDLYYD